MALTRNLSDIDFSEMIISCWKEKNVNIKYNLVENCVTFLFIRINNFYMKILLPQTVLRP